MVTNTSGLISAQNKANLNKLELCTKIQKRYTTTIFHGTDIMVEP